MPLLETVDTPAYRLKTAGAGVLRRAQPTFVSPVFWLLIIAASL